MTAPRLPASRSATEKQLKELAALVEGQIDVKTAIETGTAAVVAALGGLATARATQAAADGVVASLTSPAYTEAANQNAPTFTAAGYGAKNKDVVDAYPTYLADQATWATGGGFGMGDTLDQFLADHYRLAGKDEGRSFATGGSMRVRGPSSGDRVPVNLMANGGETVSVTREDSMARVATALEGLRAEISGLRADVTRGNDHQKRVKDILVEAFDGSALATRAA
jgi:hypothetical protein